MDIALLDRNLVLFSSYTTISVTLVHVIDDVCDNGKSNTNGRHSCCHDWTCQLCGLGVVKGVVLWIMVFEKKHVQKNCLSNRNSFSK